MLRRLRSSLVLVASGLVLAGCGDLDEKCERLCSFLAECTKSELPDDCSARCEDDMDNESDACLDALDALLECVDAHEGCSDAVDACVPEAERLDDKC